MDTFYEKTSSERKYKFNDDWFIRVQESEHTEFINSIERNSIYGFVVATKKNRERVFYWEEHVNRPLFEIQILETRFKQLNYEVLNPKKTQTNLLFCTAEELIDIKAGWLTIVNVKAPVHP